MEPVVHKLAPGEILVIVANGQIGIVQNQGGGMSGVQWHKMGGGY